MLDKTRNWPPDYVAKYAWRQRQLLLLRERPELIHCAKVYYSSHPVEFVDHWCDTYDPRNAGKETPARIPFCLFPKQVELITFLDELRKAEESGLIEKCRDMGATWGAVCYSVWMWLFLPGASVGWGSRKEQLVDKIGDPDSIFEKIRMTVEALPRLFWPRGFNMNLHASYMKLVNPETEATITGESGDNIGRGGRKLMYFKDESAHYERPERIEAALTDNTRIQVDISSVHGINNVFHRRRQAGHDWSMGEPIVRGRTNVLVMDWRDHPDKDQSWYEARKKKATEEGLLPNFYQEVDRNYAASIEGLIIMPEWVDAAIAAHDELGIGDDGVWRAALDVADGGTDTNAIAIRKGIVLKKVEEWGERDTGNTARRAVGACSGLGPIELDYDCIGVGAGVKAESNRLADEALMPKGMRFVPWNAASAVLNPHDRVVEGDDDSPKNGDFFYNLKAQAWWMVARRFELTWRVMNVQGFKARADHLILLDPKLPLIHKIKKELCQATIGYNTRTLKLVVNKTPDGTKSPNLADAIVMCYFPVPAESVPEAVYATYSY